MDTRADALVLFGATGDLLRRKLIPAIYAPDVLSKNRALAGFEQAWNAFLESVSQELAATGKSPK